MLMTRILSGEIGEGKGQERSELEDVRMLKDTTTT